MDLSAIARKLGQMTGGLRRRRKNLFVLTPLVVPLPSSAFARRLNLERALALGNEAPGVSGHLCNFCVVVVRIVVEKEELPDVSREFLNRLMEGTPVSRVQVGVQDDKFAYQFE